MSTIKTNAILDASGGNTTTINGTTPTAYNTMGKNRIINGAMEIDQRNAGASTTVTGNGYYSCDRWLTYSSQSSKYSVQQNAGSVTPPAGFSNYIGITSLSAYSISASDYFVLIQKIEGYNIVDFAFGTANAKTITVSFWVRSSLTGTFGGALRGGSSGGGYARSYPFTYTISSANTWEQKTITVIGDTTDTWESTNNTGLYLQFGLGVGSTYSGTAGSWQASGLNSATGATSVVGTNGATFYITGVQLEVGSVATEFERRPYGTELALCQRYYVQNLNPSLGGIGAASSFVTVLKFPVSMRASPTASVISGVTPSVDLFGVGSVNTTTNTFDSYSVNSCRYYAGGMSGSTFGQPCHLNNNSVQASAEL